MFSEIAVSIFNGNYLCYVSERFLQLTCEQNEAEHLVATKQFIPQLRVAN